VTSEDPRGDGADDAASDRTDDAAGSATGDERPSGDGPDDRNRRPLLAGVIGLLAGIAGGIAGTTIAPNSLILTIVLVVLVAGVVTLASLRLLARL